MRKGLAGRPYTFFVLAGLVTVGMYGVFFKNYYLAFLGRRQERA
jgi:hypothetical protein